MLKYSGRISIGVRSRLAAIAVIAGIGIAASSGTVWATDTTVPAGSPSHSSAHGAASGEDHAHGVDALIDHLHTELKITPAQEGLWDKLAAVMRENAAKMSELAKKRHDNANKMNAVDDLKSYSEISAVHAEGTKKMIPAFESLYDSMSPAQKAAADSEFRQHYATHHHDHAQQK